MIDVEQLSKRYGRQMALEAVSFRAEPGEILGLLGPNGAGKTTTMRILTGYLPADAGQVWVAGVEVGEDPMAVRRAIGYLPEQPPLYPEMTEAQVEEVAEAVRSLVQARRFPFRWSPAEHEPAELSSVPSA